MKSTVLMVAEKPMLAQSIANILSAGRMSTRKGWNGACSVHEYDSTFLGQPAHFKMTSTCGHVMGLDFHPKYNNWDKTDPLQLYDAETLKKETNPKLRLPDFLASEATGCDYLVLWLDCDKEGENICFEVINAVAHKLSKRGGQDPIYRAHFSAITQKDINQVSCDFVSHDHLLWNLYNAPFPCGFDPNVVMVLSFCHVGSTFKLY